MAKRIKQPHGGELAILEKGETANPNGRPRRVFSQLSKEWTEMGIERATKERIIEAYESLLGLTLHEITEIAGEEKDTENPYPALIRIAAKEMTGKRGIEILREMLDRAHGKPAQSVDHKNDGGKFDTNPLSALPIEKQAEILRMLNAADADK